MLSRIGESDPDLTIFQTPWWLDAVTGGRWSAVTAGDGVNAHLWLPFVQTRRLGMRLIGMPPLTHTLGPVIRLPAGRAVLRATQRRKLIDAAFAALPRFDGFLQVLDPGVEDALDYVINGLDVAVRYTFRIDTACGTEALWRSLKHNTRSVIRKAERSVVAGEMASLMVFHEFYEANLQRRGAANHHERRVYEGLAEALAARSCYRLLAARDRESGRPIAAALVVWDSRTLYYLRATRDPVDAGRGVGSHLFWQAVTLAAEKGLIFDSDSFHGRGGALFLEAFGARPVPRLAVSWRCRRLKLLEASERQMEEAAEILGQRLRRMLGARTDDPSRASMPRASIARASTQ